MIDYVYTNKIKCVCFSYCLIVQTNKKKIPDDSDTEKEKTFDKKRFRFVFL